LMSPAHAGNRFLRNGYNGSAKLLWPGWEEARRLKATDATSHVLWLK